MGVYNINPFQKLVCSFALEHFLTDCSLPVQMGRVKQPSIEEPSGGKGGPTVKEEALAKEREERFSKLSAWKVRKLMDVDIHSDHAVYLERKRNLVISLEDSPGAVIVITNY